MTVVEKERLNDLINGCIRHDRKCQEGIYEMFYGKMMAVCLRYTKNRDQAKDILQDGFIKVFKNIGKFNFEGSFEGWVRRIMVNTAIDFFRRKQASQLYVNENQSLDTFEGDFEEEDEGEDRYASLNIEVGDIVEAMQQLSPAYRTVFNLYVFEDFTHKEIAEELDISVGTSKSNLAKARANLKKILTKELKGGNEQ